MTDWAATDLALLGDATEVEITPDRPDGSPGSPRTVWIVTVSGHVIVRSFRGAGGGWYRRIAASRRGRLQAGRIDTAIEVSEADTALREAVDAAYRTKYGRYGAGYIGPMTSQDAADTTLELRPAQVTRTWPHDDQS